ncbi:MAG TPA: exosortase H-associated membrane protein [Candidatus Acidoferrales bacterium]|nr:exosortase H-associated membrane protein [Candidatus Acidoferrales bacterium]
MPRPERYVRFLVRGSLLLTGVLALWWFALQPPMLFALRVAGEAAISLLPGSTGASAITLDESGDWNFRMPADEVHREAGGPVQVNSVEFTMPRRDVALFTFSVPLFWALMLASPGVRRHLNAMLWGTVLLAGVEVLLLLAHLGINRQAILAAWHPGASAWWRELASYLITSVMPFFAPLCAAVWLQPELRALIFPWPARAERPAPRKAALR